MEFTNDFISVQADEPLNGSVSLCPIAEGNGVSELSGCALVNCLEIVRSSGGLPILGCDFTKHLIVSDLAKLHQELLNFCNLDCKGQWNSNGFYDRNFGRVFRGKCPYFGHSPMENVTNKRRGWSTKLGCTRMYTLSARCGLEFVNEHCEQCSKVIDVSMDTFKRSESYLKCNIISNEATTKGNIWPISHHMVFMITNAIVVEKVNTHLTNCEGASNKNLYAVASAALEDALPELKGVTVSKKVLRQMVNKGINAHVGGISKEDSLSALLDKFNELQITPYIQYDSQNIITAITWCDIVTRLNSDKPSLITVDVTHNITS